MFHTNRTFLSLLIKTEWVLERGWYIFLDSSYLIKFLRKIVSEKLDENFQKHMFSFEEKLYPLDLFKIFANIYIEIELEILRGLLNIFAFNTCISPFETFKKKLMFRKWDRA